VKSHARLVIIGGGISGCSLLYHLTKLGWTDVVLIEKDELTSGSTWLAAGNIVQWAPDRCTSRLLQHSISLYQSLEAETGQQTGWQTTGSLRLATTSDRMDEYRHVLSKDRALGIACSLVSAEEAKGLFPFMEADSVVGAMYHEFDGHCDPAGTAMALAKGARHAGAEIYRSTRATDLSRTAGGEWVVHTEKGEITCEVVVNAGGLWAARVGAMAGVFVPTIAIEHHHLLFEGLPDIEALEDELISLRDPDVPFYLRREGTGLLVGVYEAECRAWGADGVPWDWAQSDLPADLDRIQDYILRTMDRVPMLQEAGLKHICAGPIAYTPDGRQLLGPVGGVPNFYCIAGCNFGIAQAGGVGKYLAEWIVEGEPSIDLNSLDPRRFGDWTSKAHTFATTHEAYRLQYQLAIPDTERDAGRPLKTPPIYDLQKAQGAVFGSQYGWERPNWFAPDGVEACDRLSFRRGTNYFEHVGRECLAARDGVAVYENSAFAKYLVSGSESARYLDRLTCGRLPKAGRIGYNLMLTAKGFVSDDMTMTRLADDSFYVVAPAASELLLLQHMEEHLPLDGTVTVENVTNRYGVLAVVGPQSRALLSKLTDTELCSEHFPYLSWQDVQVGGVPARAMRVNFVGELGWELHHEPIYQRQIYQQILEAGQEFRVVNCGMRAVLASMRLEKGYVLAPDICGEETPFQAGLEFFVKMDKGDFIGRAALEEHKTRGAPTRLVTLVVEAGDADAIGEESIWNGDDMVGRVTSGGWGHRVGSSLALAYIDTQLSEPGTRVAVEILNEKRPATVVQTPYYDPKNMKVRA
jgi:dimethylglycine dehydrogenase